MLGFAWYWQSKPALKSPRSVSKMSPVVLETKKSVGYFLPFSSKSGVCPVFSGSLLNVNFAHQYVYSVIWWFIKAALYSFWRLPKNMPVWELGCVTVSTQGKGGKQSLLLWVVTAPISLCEQVLSGQGVKNVAATWCSGNNFSVW